MSNRFHHKAHLRCQKKHVQRVEHPHVTLEPPWLASCPPPSWLGELIRAIIFSSCAPSVVAEPISARIGVNEL